MSDSLRDALEKALDDELCTCEQCEDGDKYNDGVRSVQKAVREVLAAHPVEPAMDEYSLEEIAAKIADRVPYADLDGFTLSERLRIGKAVAPLFQDLLGARAQPANGG